MADTVDWHFLFECVSALAAVAAAAVACFAVNTWKQQRKAELAEEIILTAKHLAEAIRHIRNSFGPMMGEGGHSPSGHEAEQQKKQKDLYHSRFELLRAYSEVISRASYLKIKASLHFPGVEQHLAEITDVVDDIWVSTRTLMKSDGKDFDSRQKHEGVIFDAGHGDEIEASIHQAIAGLETKLKKYLY